MGELMMLQYGWETANRYPYFAHLKVMRRVLGCVRQELETCRGELLGYLFFEDRFRFLVRGAKENLAFAMSAARHLAEADFRLSDGKALWGEENREEVSQEGMDAVLDRMLREPVEVGLAPSPGDYPWCGGTSLLTRV